MAIKTLIINLNMKLIIKKLLSFNADNQKDGARNKQIIEATREN